MFDHIQTVEDNKLKLSFNPSQNGDTFWNYFQIIKLRIDKKFRKSPICYLFSQWRQSKNNSKIVRFSSFVENLSENYFLFEHSQAVKENEPKSSFNLSQKKWILSELFFRLSNFELTKKVGKAQFSMRFARYIIEI